MKQPFCPLVNSVLNYINYYEIKKHHSIKYACGVFLKNFLTVKEILNYKNKNL